ncbi:MAG: PASTA domain-containing protein, partial [Culicoidibacterales bacterium]
QNLEKATAQLNQIGIQPIVLGSGSTVIHQSHPAGDTVRSNERIIVLTNSSEFNLPNLTGWSYSDVQALALISNLNIEIQGSGSVKAQSTPPNTPVKSGDTLTVSLE